MPPAENPDPQKCPTIDSAGGGWHSGTPPRAETRPTPPGPNQRNKTPALPACGSALWPGLLGLKEIPVHVDDP